MYIHVGVGVGAGAGAGVRALLSLAALLPLGCSLPSCSVLLPRLLLVFVFLRPARR